MKTIAHYFSLVKFSHTIFAMPFALVGFTLGVYSGQAQFNWLTLAYIVLCMVFARNAAMGFNRWADRHIDAANQRTANREIPAGKLKPSAALAFVIINIVLFILTTYFINPLCFYLSPVALFTVLVYSYTKRFTSLCHFVLGLGLSLAPIGAYIATTGQFDLVPLLFSAIVLLWTGGFDIIYALQDEEYDKGKDLYSIPSMLGAKNALRLSSAVHSITAGLVAAVWFIADGIFHPLYWAGAAIFIAMLFYQHRIVKPHDISRVNLAFGTTNGIASVLYGAFTIVSLVWY